MADHLRILVVEDDNLLQRSLVWKIQDRYGDKVSVETADDGEEAIGKLSLLEFNLVVSDLEMKPMNGLGLFNKMKDSGYGEIPFILYTGNTRMDGRVIYVGAHGGHVIQKNSHGKLWEKIEELFPALAKK